MLNIVVFPILTQPEWITVLLSYLKIINNIFLPSEVLFCQQNFLITANIILCQSLPNKNWLPKPVLPLRTRTTLSAEKNPPSPQMQLLAYKPSWFFVLFPRIFLSCHIVRSFFQSCYPAQYLRRTVSQALSRNKKEHILSPETSVKMFLCDLSLSAALGEGWFLPGSSQKDPEPDLHRAGRLTQLLAIDHARAWSREQL